MLDHDDILWEMACGVENIIQAACACFGYVDPDKYLDRLRPSYRDWWLDREQRAARLSERMHRGYIFGEYRVMSVHEPKERTINYHSDFEDNIAELAVLRVLEPRYMETFSPNVFGSIKGRGLLKGAELLSELLRDNPCAYYVQTDCRKYYDSIDHGILKAHVRKLADSPGCADFMERLIDSYGPGIPIGIPSGHYNGNLLLSPVDAWLDSNPVVTGHVRNMDDIIIVVRGDKEHEGDSEEYARSAKRNAKRVLEELTGRCAELCLTLKPNARVAPVRCGIDALGFVIYPTHKRIRKRMKTNMRRKSAKLVKHGVRGKAYKQAMASHYGWCVHADARHLLQKIMGDNLKLFNMEIRRRRDIKPHRKFFDLGKERFVSITSLDGVEVFVMEVMETLIKGEPKIAVKFCVVSELGCDNPDERTLSNHARYTITKSVVMRDRLRNDADIIPFAATIRKVNGKYWCYE